LLKYFWKIKSITLPEKIVCMFILPLGLQAAKNNFFCKIDRQVRDYIFTIRKKTSQKTKGNITRIEWEERETKPKERN
jgi:hypothetical protein